MAGRSRLINPCNRCHCWCARSLQRGAVRAAFYTLVQVGGYIEVASNLGIAVLQALGARIRTRKRMDGTETIFAGEGELRFGGQRHRIRKDDVIACPTGGPEVAHQIINTGAGDMRYLALSNLAEIDACEYPDSNKVVICADEANTPRLWKMFRAEANVEYYDRESTEPPQGGPDR